MVIDHRYALFGAVAREGTISAYAKSNYVDSSGISRQLRQLQDDLGVHLFRRDGRVAKLTPAGVMLEEFIQRLDADWLRTLGDMRRQEHSVTGRLNVCGFPTAVTALLAPLVTKMQRDYPGVRACAIEAEPSTCYAMLDSGEVDLGISVSQWKTPPRSHPRFFEHELFREPIELLVPAGHELARRSAVMLADAAEERWIVGTDRHDGPDQIRTACQVAGFTPSIAHHAQEWASVTALVGAGHGVSLVSRLACLPTQFGAVRVPLVGDPVPSRVVLWCTRRGAEHHPVIEAAVAELHEIVAAAMGSRNGVTSGANR